MKRGPLVPTLVRLVCYVIVGTAYVLLLASLSGCTLATEALRGIGFPVGEGATEAARQVDAAIRTWFDNLIWGGVGIAASEGTRATHSVVKKRRAKKAAATPVH